MENTKRGLNAGMSINKSIANFKIYLIRRLFPFYIIKKCQKLILKRKPFLALKIMKETAELHLNNKKVYKFLAQTYETCYEKNVEHRSDTGSNEVKIFLKMLNNYIYKEVAENGIRILWKERDNSINPDDEYELILHLLMLYKEKADNENYYDVLELLKNKYRGYVESDNIGYRKLLLYDNGESRIEYYKKVKHTDRLIITFDSINMTWDRMPFAFKLLSKQNLDIIAVRKRKKGVYQQDLTRETFMKHVKKIVSGYKDVMVYGFSLGAYNALYFTGGLRCRILAIAPRLSIHPLYGRKKKKHSLFKQEMHLPKNSNISPIIVYDPKNDIDNRYVNKEIVKSFPRAILLKVPFSGHGVAVHLSKIGVLKEFVLQFLQGEIPTYDRRLRMNSPVYYRNLARLCFKKNKMKWALSAIEKSLSLDGSSQSSVKIKIKVLMALGKKELATQELKYYIDKFPSNLSLRLFYFDNSIELKKYDDAKEILRDLEALFPNKVSVKYRMKILDKHITR